MYCQSITLSPFEATGVSLRQRKVPCLFENAKISEVNSVFVETMDQIKQAIQTSSVKAVGEDEPCNQDIKTVAYYHHFLLGRTASIF